MSLARPLAALLQAIAALGATDLDGEIAAFLTSPAPDDLLPLMLKVLERPPTPRRRDATPLSTIDRIRAHAISRVTGALAVPARAADDWSIDWRGRCTCKLCGTLRSYLADRTRRNLAWPLNTSERAHIHRAIESAELPITHQTRRSGRPFTLVLEKLRSFSNSPRRSGASSSTPSRRYPRALT